MLRQGNEFPLGDEPIPRWRKAVAGALLVLILFFGAIQCYCAIQWAARPFAGFLVHENLVVGPDNSPNWSGRPGGIQFYDLVLEVEGQSLDSAEALYKFVADWTPGFENDAIHYVVDRWGTNINLAVRPSTFRVGDLWVSMIPTFLVGMVCLLSAMLIFYMNPTGHQSTPAFITILTLTGLWFVTAFDYQTYQRFIVVILTVLPLVPAGLLHLSLTFPQPWGFVKKRPAIVWIPYAVMAAAAVINAYLFYADPGPWRYMDNFLTVLVAVTVFIFVVCVAVANLRTKEEMDRMRTQTILLGSIVGFLLPATLAVFSEIPYYLLAFLLVAFPIAVAYCVVRHNLFHVDVIIRRGVEYAVLTCVTAGIYLLVVVGIVNLTERFFPEKQSFEVLYVGFTLVFAMAFNRMRTNVQAVIDRIFFRSKCDYRATIQSLCDSLASLMGLQEVIEHITLELSLAMHLESAHILLGGERSNEYRQAGTVQPGRAPVAFAFDHFLPRLLLLRRRPVTLRELMRVDAPARERLRCLDSFEAMNARIVLPLIVKNELIGILALGKKKTGVPFTSEDIALLRALASAGAVAIENAQTLERIRRTSRQLNSLRKLGVAMASVKDLDALLELTLNALCTEMDFASAAVFLSSCPDGSLPSDCWVMGEGTGNEPHQCRVSLAEIPRELAHLLFPGMDPYVSIPSKPSPGPLLPLLKDFDSRSVFRLGTADSPTGVIVLKRPARTESVPAGQEAVLEALVDGVASAIRYIQLYDLMEGITENSPSAVAVVDELDRIIFENASFHKMFPAEKTEDGDADLFSRLHFSTTSELELLSQVTRVRQESNATPEILIEGSRYLRYSCFTFGRQGKLRDHLGLVMQDVTEEYKIRDQLLHSEKVAAIGQVISGVAHELNNPLAGVIGYIDLILSRGITDTTMKHLQKASDSALRCKKIVQNLVNFVRKSETEKELACCNQLVQKTLDLLSYQMLVENINVEMDLDSQLPPTMMDANQVQQVLLNLINNAFHAMKESPRTSGDSLTLRTIHNRPMESIQILITDTGKGIPSAALDRIFEPFYTTKPAGEGTGLGLSLSYGIIRSHNGLIEVESIEGTGTTFTITLPILRELTPSSEVKPEEIEAHGPLRILVVDDEEAIRDMLRRMLRDAGHEVVQAKDGREALDIVATQDFDIVLSDVKMPRMDGITFFCNAVETKPELADRCILVTGDTITRETDQFLTTSGLPAVPKPFTRAELLLAISKRYRGINGKGKKTNGNGNGSEAGKE